MNGGALAIAEFGPLRQQRANDIPCQFSNVAAQGARPFRQETYGAEMERSSGSIPRTIHDSSAEQSDVPTMKKKVRLALISDYGDHRSAHKAIAKHAQCSPRTVEAWMEERSLPGFEYVWRLGKHSPAIQKLFLEMISHDMDLDPRAYSAFLELQRMLRR